jgi:hypothetical protein
MKRLLSIELQKNMDEQSKSVLSLTYFILLSFIAMIASIKFDVGFLKFTLLKWGYSTSLSFGTSTLILLPF